MVNRILFFVFAILLSVDSIVYGQITKEEYIEQYHKIAIREMKDYGIPASIKLAQGILESNYGNSLLARKGNNHFGIKCHGWQGAFIRLDDDVKDECFRKYKHAEESFVDHSRFLVEKPRYADLFKLKITDYKGWAYGLKKAGYATNPAYAEKLIKIIEDENLARFDFGEVKARPNRESVFAKKVHSIDSPRSVFENNGVDFIIIAEDDNLKDLHANFGYRGWELPEYNDLAPGLKLYPGDTLYIEQKARKASSENEYYVVAADDTMWKISQKFGVRLSRLYYFNRMDKGVEPAVGEKLNLRKRKAKP